jgi:hypothetical protein
VSRTSANCRDTAASDWADFVAGHVSTHTGGLLCVRTAQGQSGGDVMLEKGMYNCHLPFTTLDIDAGTGKRPDEIARDAHYDAVTGKQPPMPTPMDEEQSEGDAMLEFFKGK